MLKDRNNKQFQALGENSTVDSWYDYYESELKIFRANYFSGQLELYEKFIGKLFQEANTWPSPRREYFKFHGCLYTMQKVENNYSIWTSSYHYNSKAYFRNRTKSFIVILVDTIANVANVPDEIIDTFNSEAMEKLRELMLRTTESHFDWLNIYTSFWTSVFQNSKLLDEEIQLLAHLPLVRDTKLINQYNWQIAKGHFLFLKGEVDLALRHFIEVNIKLNEIIGYLEVFYEQQNLNALAKWLEATRDLLGTADEEEFRQVTFFWMVVAKFKDDYQECLNMLRRYLPKSNDLYEEVLIKAGHWKKWVEFHLNFENTPNSINPNYLRKVEEVDISLLLPLYHQYIIRLLQEKNRGAYKEAVRFMKKLQTYYEVLDRRDYWEQYLENLIQKNIRLRAFQEEIRNGKLLI